MTPASGVRRLYQLARLYGVQTAYYDVSHRRRTAPVETLLDLLHSLGAPVASVGDAGAAVRERQQARWRQRLEPVTVIWEGQPARVKIRLPVTTADSLLDCTLKTEDGESQNWRYPGAGLRAYEEETIEGIKYVSKRITLPMPPPPGYHRLQVEAAGETAESFIIAAPLRAYQPETETETWGVFLPLYALHSEKSPVAGNFGGLAKLAEWVAGLKGGVVATLPLLPTFTETPTDVSPYLPVSRRMWNELYIDIDSVPELADCPEARNIIESPSFQQESQNLQDAPTVDYPRLVELKRMALTELVRCLFAGQSERRAALESFAEENPAVADYARFRAARERQNRPWRDWPEPLRDGDLKESDCDGESYRYHLYTQWLARQQMQSLRENLQRRGVRLYLDLPAGVHPDGYDVWREHDDFLPGVTAGAPPDAVFTGGQDWLFPPLHPETGRLRGYRYVIDYLRHHLGCADILRLDHVMGLHRLFCIPAGMTADRGAYIHYPVEEYYAILALESHRRKTVIVGEDLGTVPGYVRPALNRHGLQRMFVLHYELITDTRQKLPPVPASAVASLNTHDMTPFTGFWEGMDIPQRQELGLLDQTGALREEKIRRDIRRITIASLRRRGWLHKRATGAAAVIRGCLSYLAASRAPLVLVNLEDLWGETRPQNVPGTGDSYPSWRLKARYSFEEFSRMPPVTDTLQAVNEIREKHEQENRNGGGEPAYR